MKKLVRATVLKSVLKKFDENVSEGRRAFLIGMRIKEARLSLRRRAKKAHLYETVSTLVDVEDIALLKSVAKAEGTTLGKVLGELL